MKNIQFCNAEKFSAEAYEKVDEGIFLSQEEDPITREQQYVTALSFEREPEHDEGESSANIGQYPLNDIMDKSLVSAEDFLEEKMMAVQKSVIEVLQVMRTEFENSWRSSGNTYIIKPLWKTAWSMLT